MNSGGMWVQNSGPIPNTHIIYRIAIPHHGAGDLFKRSYLLLALLNYLINLFRGEQIPTSSSKLLNEFVLERGGGISY